MLGNSNVDINRLAAENNSSSTETGLADNKGMKPEAEKNHAFAHTLASDHGIRRSVRPLT